MTRIYTTSCWVFLLLLVTYHGAEAGVLHTPSVTQCPGGQNRVQCQALNVGNKPLTVLMELFVTSTGILKRSSGQITLEPGRGTNSVNSGSLSGCTPFYCKFTIKGRKKNVRASIAVTEGGNDHKLVVPAE